MHVLKREEVKGIVSSESPYAVIHKLTGPKDPWIELGKKSLQNKRLQIDEKFFEKLYG